MSKPNLFQAIDECMKRANIDQPTFFDMSRIFNIDAEHFNEANGKIVVEDKLKNKFLDIFNTEGENYKDYLKLPKFNILRPTTLQILHSLFNNIWDRFSQQVEQINKEKYVRELEKLIPEFITLEDVQQYHLGLFNNFKSSRFCRTNDSQPERNHLHNLARSYDHSSMETPDQKRFQNQNYMINSYKYGNNFPVPNRVYPKIQDDPKYTTAPLWNEDKFMVHASSLFPLLARQPQFNEFLQNQKPKVNHFHRANPQQIPSPILPNLQSKMIGLQEKSVQIFTGNDDQFAQKLQKLMFIQCACEGDMANSSEPYITCTICNFCFHRKCLFLLQNSTQQVCPCCKLKQGSNIFINIHQEPVAKRWSTNLKTRKLSFSLTEQQISLMKSQRKSCKPTSQVEYQLKFHKIIRRTQPSQNVSRVDKLKKFNHLPLPAQFLENVKAKNMFQINIKFQDETQHAQDCRFFFAIFLVQKFSQSTLVQELFSNLDNQNSTSQEFLNNCRADKQYIDIVMKDRSTQRSITYPVRGNNCTHPQVFDYLATLQYSKLYDTKFTNIYCVICDKLCDRIIVDRFLHDRIKEADQRQKEGEDQVLRYYGQGKVEWNPENLNMNSEEQESGSESEKISQSLS